jgi:transposase InsO family protein
MGFIDTMRGQGHAVESICRVLCEQGCQIAARTYRAWARPGRPVADRTISDARVVDAVRGLAWTTDQHGRRRLTPEGLYGRRKMTAAVCRSLPDASPGSVDRAMRTLGLAGIRRSKGIRTTIPAKDGRRAADLLDRDFTADAPNRKRVSDYTYCRTWAGWVYVAFIVDCFAQKIVAWHAATAKDVDLVMTPLRIALWARDRDGHPAGRAELICHSDAGSQGGFNWSSQHLMITEVLDGSSTRGCRSRSASEVEVAWSSEVPARSRGRVLDGDREGAAGRGSCGRDRRGAGGWCAVVPQRWRHAAIRSEAQAVGPLPVVC